MNNTFESLVSMKMQMNKVTYKSMRRELKISFPTLKSKIENNTITLAELIKLKKLLKISNGEMMAVLS